MPNRDEIRAYCEKMSSRYNKICTDCGNTVTEEEHEHNLTNMPYFPQFYKCNNCWKIWSEKFWSAKGYKIERES